MTLIDEIKNKKEETYKQFVQKYKERIDKEIKNIFIDKGLSHWHVGVYDDQRRGTLLGDIYYDSEVNGGKFNNMLRYLRSQGFHTTASYWCGGSCVNADGFTVTL